MRFSRLNILRRALLLGPHTCPWWFGYSFDNPFRRFFHDPDEIFEGVVQPGQTVVDIGCGMGYFSIALARIVGPGGKVIALDVQPQMIKRARRRAEHQGLAERIEFRVCNANEIGVRESVDFVLAFWVVHEIEDLESFLIRVRSLLKPGGRLMIVEPKGHVSARRFTDMVETVLKNGFEISEGPVVRFSRSVVCSPFQKTHMSTGSPPG